MNLLIQLEKGLRRQKILRKYIAEMKNKEISVVVEVYIYSRIMENKELYNATELEHPQWYIESLRNAEGYERGRFWQYE